MKMDTVLFLRNVCICTCESTKRHNPEEQHRHPHRRENLKSHIIAACVLSKEYGFVSANVSTTYSVATIISLH
jgi:hypothetical protein